MKISIIYHSQSGNTKHIAESVSFGIKDIDEVEVKLMSIDKIDDDFVSESKAIVFGCPTYCGTYSWQIKKWFDTTPINLSGKLGSVFVTEDYIGGGADVAELSMAGLMLVRGMLVYSAGFTKGQPFTHYGAVAIKSGSDEQFIRAKFLGERVAEKVFELFHA